MATNTLSKDNETIRVLVYGSSGAGKSSMISLLSDEDIPINEGQLAGCTFHSEDYSAKRKNKFYIFTDTAGLNEADNGTVEHKTAIKQLLKLVKKAKCGYHLLIHVRKCEPLKEHDFQNYKLIVKTLFENNVKCICVNTGAEASQNLNDFWEKNQDSFRERGMIFTNGASVCCKQTSESVFFAEGFRKLSQDSKEILWKLIENIKFNNQVYIPRDPIWKILAKMWNSFVDSLKRFTSFNFFGYFKIDSHSELRRTLREVCQLSDTDCNEILQELE